MAFVGALRFVGSRTSVVSSQRLLCSLERGRGSSGSVRVLYDGECPICVKEISFLQFVQRNRAEKVDFVDISLPEYDGTKYGVSYEIAMEEMTVIDTNNKIHRGVPAFTVMYSAVGLGWLGRHTFLSYLTYQSKFKTFHDSDSAAKALPVLIQIICLDTVGTSLMGWYLDKTQVTYLGSRQLW
ncbi:unnamed protein product [Leuciscus chuanchicus]